MELNIDALLIISATILIVYTALTWRWDHFKKKGVAHMKPWPLLGNMGRLAFARSSFYDHIIYIYNQFRGHGIAGYFEFLAPVLMIRDPEILRTITVKDFDYFTDHKTAVREDVDPLFGRNMFLLQGQRWRDMRHTLSPAFTSSKMKGMFQLIQKAGEQLGDFVDEKCKDTKDNPVVMEMKDLMTRYANDVIASAAFGLHCDSLRDPNNEFYTTNRKITNFTGLQSLKFLGYLLSIKLMKFFKVTLISKKDGDFLRHLVHDTIRMRERENILRPDMIHLLMQAKKGTLTTEATDEDTEGHSFEKGKKKLDLTDDDITGNALLFLLAGFDTSSTLMCFMSQLLAMHPDIQRRVQDEMDNVIQTNGGKITYEAIHKMKYLDMVISETLRMYPPAPFVDRLCVKPYVLEETANSPRILIKPGDGLIVPISALHHDPGFFPDPEKFDPERFSDENKHNIKQFTYMPFGIGPRICLGMRFALMEAKIAMTSLLTRFNIEVVPKTVVPIVLTKGSLNMSIEGDFWLGIRPRIKSP